MNYRTAIVSTLAEIGEAAWSELLASQQDANPFLSYAFLHALHESGCASADTGWQPNYLVLWQGDVLAAALPLYLKMHSYASTCSTGPGPTRISSMAWNITRNCCRLFPLRP